MPYNQTVLTDQDKIWIKDLFRQQLQRHREEERLWVREQLDEHTRAFSERLEKVETTLLTEFHKWASPQDMQPLIPAIPATDH